jgi:hypothetical protein
VLLTFEKAVIFIMKLATVLRCFKISQHSVLALAELNYQEAGIDLKIQEYLAGTSEEQSVEQLANFIMATDIGLLILSPFKIISHDSFSAISGFDHEKRQKGV